MVFVVYNLATINILSDILIIPFLSERLIRSISFASRSTVKVTATGGLTLLGLTLPYKYHGFHWGCDLHLALSWSEWLQAWLRRARMELFLHSLEKYEEFIDKWVEEPGLIFIFGIEAKCVLTCGSENLTHSMVGSFNSFPNSLGFLYLIKLYL